MAENVESLILEPLRRINHRMDNIEADVSDIRLRMTATEDHLATLVMSVAGVNHRLDRMGERVERIERRLDLTESK